jgi:hypothetical protein
MIGEEGQAVWRIFASPISARSLVKSKFFFIALFSFIVLVITGAVGSVIYHVTLRAAIIAFFEGVFLILAIGAISLSNGIGGADFTETPRRRMIRQKTVYLNLGECALAGLAVLAPFFPYVASSILSTFVPNLFDGWVLDPLLALVISAVIATVLTVIFYRISLKNARALLKRAEI